MVDAEDFILSTSEGNADVNGVKVGEPLTGHADGNAELRPIAACFNRQSSDGSLLNMNFRLLGYSGRGLKYARERHRPDHKLRSSGSESYSVVQIL